MKRSGFSEESKRRSREKAMKKQRAPMKRVGKKRHYRNDREIDEANKRAFKEASWVQRVCAACGRAGNDWQAHHVIEKQKLRIIGRMDLVWDIRNSLRLCEEPCHGNHTRGSQRLNLAMLTDDNYEFAWHVLGAEAADYLRARYNGKDPRWDDLNDACNGYMDG